MSWLVVKDVNDGRDAMNLSDWPKDNPRAQQNGWRT
jgi:hypothetical protein